jgi:hypothetical protein
VAEPRIEVRASTEGEHAAMRVTFNGRIVLDAEWTDETSPRAMVSALGDAIAAVARADEARRQAAKGRKRRA